jgi:hypothetical protein
MVIEIISSRYDKLSVKHFHERYKTSFNHMDTIAFIRDKNGERAQITFLMCEGEEFEIDNPYVPDSKKDFNLYIKNHNIIGDWYIKNNGIELEKIVDKLNSFIPKKELCNKKRYLNKSASLTSMTPLVDHEGYYWDDVEMPVIDGSNSVDHRNNSIQAEIDKCLDTIVEAEVVRLSYYVNEKGDVDKVEFDKFSQPDIVLRRKIEACLLALKFGPANYKGESVKVKCNTLIGINTSEKYKLYEDISKSDPNKKKKVKIPQELTKILKRQVVSNSEEIFITRNDTYEELINFMKKKSLESDNYFYNAVRDSQIDEMEKITEVEEKPNLFNEKYFEELKEKIKVLFPGESYDETIQFIIEKDGSISNTRVAKETNGKVAEWLWESLYKDLFYIPGKHQGKIVRVQILVNIANK